MNSFGGRGNTQSLQSIRSSAVICHRPLTRSLTALRTLGSLSRWQARLSDYPEELARARIEDPALTWGGFTPAGLLTLTRPGERLARTERMLDDASRVLRIVYALNRV